MRFNPQAIRFDPQAIRRFIIAGTLASGLASAGVAACAQTVAPPTTATSTGVSISTVGIKADHHLEAEQATADARRVAFRHLGTSL